MASVLVIIQQAGPTHPELRAAEADCPSPRSQRAPFRRRPRHRRLATSDPEEAADIVWATNSAGLYQLLAGQRG
jgi:hypothetical protein